MYIGVRKQDMQY